jgi:hypothetical protein
MRNFQFGLTDAVVTCPECIISLPACGLYLKNLYFIPVHLEHSHKTRYLFFYNECKKGRRT